MSLQEDWSDDEGVGAKETSFLSEMLGTSVPPEMLAALGAESFEDVTYDGDDEDLMKDPSVQIDLRVSSGVQCNDGAILRDQLGSHRQLPSGVCGQQHQ